MGETRTIYLLRATRSFYGPTPQAHETLGDYLDLKRYLVSTDTPSERQVAHWFTREKHTHAVRVAQNVPGTSNQLRLALYTLFHTGKKEVTLNSKTRKHHNA